jgi:Cu(I)/Ag(I) efflux system membrane protein CusA/SilA
MQRIAAPMVGGVISALLMVLVVYPAIFMFWRGRGLPEGAPTAPPESDDE